jgi:hypothetical protein
MWQSSARSLKRTGQKWRLLRVFNFSALFTISKSKCILSGSLGVSPIARFVSVSPLYTPTSSGVDDNIFITRSYDATSHFETVVEDVHDVWQRVTGKDLVLKKREIEPAEE